MFPQTTIEVDNRNVIETRNRQGERGNGVLADISHSYAFVVVCSRKKSMRQG